MTWVLSGDEHVEEYRAPANVVPLEAGKKMDEMVISGELVGAVNMPIDHADVHKLIPNAEEAAFEAVAVRDELLEAHPDLAKNIFNAFAEAKRVYVEKLKTGTIENPTKLDKQNKKVMDITGDPLPYGVEPNKIVLEALMDTAAKQGIIKAPLSFEQIFAKGTLDLVG